MATTQGGTYLNYAYEPQDDPSTYNQEPLRSTSNSKSYASRAGARPDLFLDITPPPQPSTDQIPISPADQYEQPAAASATAAHKPRKASVTEKSPLQNLEVKLGDISKEEKRARAEQAEQRAMQRSGAPNTTGGSTRSSQRQTVPTQSLSRASATPSYGSTRRRSYGYDASLTGGAAAAAVSAYQASRRREYEARSSASSSAYNSSFNRAGSRSIQAQPGIDSIPSTASRSMGQTGVEQDQLQINQGGTTAMPNVTTSTQQRSAFPQAAVNIGEPMGATPALPPPPAVAQQPRKQVAFQADEAHDASAEHQGEGEQRGFRDMFHRSQHQGRRYEESQYMDEWSKGDIAILTTAELDLDTSTADGNYKAWWEDGGSQAQYPAGYDNSRSGNTSKTTFSPPLTLKCGPLLRYTGIRVDSETEKQYWRGSVMIVTEDAVSMYERPPTLRLFKQSMDLVSQPAPVNVQESNDQSPQSAHVDTIAGLPKMSRTGETLYVKPVHEVEGEVDLSQTETDEGLFLRNPPTNTEQSTNSRMHAQDGEKMGRFQEVKGARLHAERGFTFWRFNLQVELTAQETRIAYRINEATPIGFWVPARGQSMNVMFHSCNGFSLSVNADEFSGPDPLWRDVLNNHQIRPFHCMIGGGDQIYNDSAMKRTHYFQEWLALHNPEEKHNADFSPEMQDELEKFYFDRYAMWFSQGLWGMANAQIPMVNIWDDHDIIDGFGSYPHHFMSTPVFSGIGAVAFKYYMLFQQQSVPDESEQTEPSWLLGAAPGPYIKQLSHSIFLSLGKGVSFLGLDCRTERMRDEVLSQGTYDLVFDRCHREIIPGETKHLIVLLGVPIAYPRLNFLENVLTSRAMDPIKALGRAGMFTNFINKFDGGVEILDDLDDHWTAKYHKHERNWFIQELQELAAETSVRITILGGDVHLAAVGQFYSNPKLGIPKDHDHRYMPNVISSAIVNTPPPELMADVLNKRNKVHHLDKETDEDMIPLFTHDVNGKPRNNKHLLPRRNWLSIREYHPGSTPPPTPPPEEELYQEEEPPTRRRSFSFSRSRSRSRADGEKTSLLRRFSTRKAPPSSYHSPNTTEGEQQHGNYGNDSRNGFLDDSVHNQDGAFSSMRSSEDTSAEERGRLALPRSNSFHRKPTKLSRRASLKDRSGREGHIDLQGGLDIVLNCEIDQKDPAGFTVPYRLIVPALFYQGAGDPNTSQLKGGGIGGFLGSLRRPKESQPTPDHDVQGVPYDDHQLRSTPPLGGRAMPESALAGQRAIPQSNGEVLADRELPSTEPPPTFKGPVPTPAEDTPTLQTQQTSTGVPASFRGPVDLGISTSGTTQAGAVSNLPTRSISAREPESASYSVPGRSVSAREPGSRPGVPMRRWSGSGPPPPSNVDQLPASVRKRYTQMNDPAVKEYTQMTDPSRKRYSQMNDPDGHKRFSQYEPLSNSRPSSQRYSIHAPPPRPEETHRRYSSAPMEMPLLPTNINHLRSSTHRTLQSAGPSYDDAPRSVSDPQSSATAVAYDKPLPPTEDDVPSAVQEERVSTAAPPSMFPLSRGQAKRNSNPLPVFPSPLTSHAPQADPYVEFDDAANSSSPQFATTNTATAANRSQPLGREYDDEAYGYRHSSDGAPRTWRYSHIGMPEKVARHFGGFDGTPGGFDESAQNPQRAKSGRGLGGIMRRFSESAASRRRKRDSEREQREQRYNEDWNHGGDDDDSYDEYYDDERRPTWKFWQR